MDSLQFYNKYRNAAEYIRTGAHPDRTCGLILKRGMETIYPEFEKDWNDMTKEDRIDTIRKFV